MGILKKPYELSIWQDVQVGKEGHTQSMQEERVAIIGTHTMKSQNKAINPILTRNINGNVKFTFEIMSKYIDTISGLETENPFADLLKNETKLKLFYDNEWYDFIIKKINEDSTNNLIKYETVSQHINELSKNGFNVELNAKLYNNTDTIINLAKTVLQDTDWEVDEVNSHFIVQKQQEPLIPLVIPKDTYVTMYQIDDSRVDEGGALQWKRDTTSINGLQPKTYKFEENALILAFYSSCTSKPSLFQFYYFGVGMTYEDILGYITLDDDRLIKTKGCQYCLPLINEGELNQYTKKSPFYDFYIPPFMDYSPQEEDGAIVHILSKIRGERYVCSEISEYNHTLKQVLYKCVKTADKTLPGYETMDSLPVYWYTKETDYVGPTIVENVGGNNDFKDVSGWKAGVVYRQLVDSENFESAEYIGNCVPLNEFEALSKNWSEELVPGLSYTVKQGSNTTDNPVRNRNITPSNNIAQQCLISSGPYDNRAKIRSMKKGEKYNVILKLKKDCDYGFEDIDITKEMPGARIEIAYHPYDSEKQCYNRLLTFAHSLMLNPITYNFGQAILQRNQGITNNNEQVRYEFSELINLAKQAVQDKERINFLEQMIEAFYRALRNQWFFEKVENKYTGSFISSDLGEKMFEFEDYLYWAMGYSNDLSQGIINDAHQYIDKFFQEQSNCCDKNSIGDQSSGSIILIQPEKSDSSIINFPTAKNDLKWWGEKQWSGHYSTQHDDLLPWTDNWTECFGKSFISDKTSELYEKYDLPDGRYAVTQLEIARDVSEKDFALKNFQIFIYPNSTYVDFDTNKIGIQDIQIVEFQLVKHAERTVEDESGNKIIQYITPSAQKLESVKNTTYKYYADSDIQSLNSGALKQEELLPVHLSLNEPYRSQPNQTFYDYEPLYHETGQKIRSVTIKESNYFNILSTLSETFEQWPEFVITRNNNNAGEIVSKKVRFKNYIGVENQVGFRPQINLQGIKRTVNSNNIVTKMIVKPNMNTLAPDGICTIAASKANETGETALYDFTYYINHGMIDRDKLQQQLYHVGKCTTEQDKPYFQDMFGEDVKEFYPDAYYDPKDEGRWTCQNYYNRLKILNNKILELSNKNVEITLEHTRVSRDFKFQTNAITEAQNQCETLANEINYLTQMEFPSISEDLPTEWQEIIDSNDDIKRRFTQWVSHYSIVKKYSDSVKELESYLESLTVAKSQIEIDIERYTKFKQALNISFFKLYGRFIQEGTWIDQQYVDPEKYYADALSTLYTSAQPQIQYSINVSEVSAIPGYEYIQYSVGDKTYVEDPDFFGYTEEGMPYREEVILTEVVDYLEDQSKNSLKVQNYKTQFQDLFHRITASVQTAKFAEGSYERAVQRTSDSDESVQFLATALGKDNLEIKKAGSQSLSWGSEGIIIEDTLYPTKKLRLIGGQILYNVTDGSGFSYWKTLMSSDGISASVINTGHLNTGKIEIYHQDTPTFTWNSTGLTAYAWEKKTTGFSVTYGQGVRFDKCGIYGYNLGDDKKLQNFNPFANIDDVYSKTLAETSQKLIDNEAVSFYLGWSGLKVSQKINDASYSMFLGNGAAEFGSEGQNEFISVVENQGLDTESTIFSVAPTGVYMKGSITATNGFIGGENGWKISDQCIWLGNDLTSPEIYLGTKPINTSIDSQTRRNIILKVGDNFAVNRNGEMYCANGNFSGTLYTKAGSIGSFNINEHGLIATTPNDRPYCGILGSGYAYSYKNQKIVFCAGDLKYSLEDQQNYPTFYFDFSDQKNVIDSESDALHLKSLQSSVNIYPLVGPNKGCPLYHYIINPSTTSSTCTATEKSNGIIMEATANFMSLAKEINISWSSEKEGEIVMQYTLVSQLEWATNPLAYKNYFGIRKGQNQDTKLDYAAYQQNIKNIIRSSDYKPYILFKGPINYPPFLVTDDGNIQGKIRQELDVMQNSINSATDKLDSGLEEATMYYKGLDDKVWKMVFRNGILIEHSEET